MSQNGHSDDEELFLNQDEVAEEYLAGDQVQLDGDAVQVDEDDYMDEDPVQDLDEPKIRIGTGESVYAVSLHPKLDLICVGGASDKAQLFRFRLDEPHAELVKEFPSHSDSVVAIQWSNDGTHCACAGMDGKILIFKVDSDGAVQDGEVWLEGPDADITFLEWHPKGLILTCGCSDGAVWTWYVPNQSVMRVMMQATKSGASCIEGKFTDDGKYLMVATQDPQLSLLDVKMDNFVWRAEMLTPFRPSDEPDAERREVPLSAMKLNNNVVAIGDDMGRIYILNAENGRCLTTLGSHRGKSIETVDFGQLSNGQALLFTGGLDGKVLVWTMGTQLEIRSTLQHSEGINGMFVAGNKLVTLTIDGRLYTWNVASGQKLEERHIHGDTPLCYDSQLRHNQVVFASGDDMGDVCVSVV